MHFCVVRKQQRLIKRDYLPYLSARVGGDVSDASSEFGSEDLERDTDAESPVRVIRPLADFPHLRRQFRLVLSRAFYRDPWIRGLLKLNLADRPFGHDDSLIRDAMDAFIRSHLRQRSAFGYFIADLTGSAAGVIRGCCIWLLRHDKPTWRLLYDSIFIHGARFGVGKPEAEEFDRLESRGLAIMHDCQTYHYLLDLGVDPQSQSQGFGTDLLSPMLALSDQRGIPCYLESTNTRNVPFYERLGFKTKEVLLMFGCDMTLMRRDPS